MARGMRFGVVMVAGALGFALGQMGGIAPGVAQTELISPDNPVNRALPWPIGEPLDKDIFWHLHQSPQHPEAKALYWIPIRGGRLWTLLYQDADPRIAPTLTFTPN